MKYIYVVHDPECFDALSAVAFTSETDAFEYLMSWWEGYQYFMFHNDLHWALSTRLYGCENPFTFARRRLLHREADRYSFCSLTITRIPLAD